MIHTYTIYMWIYFYINKNTHWNPTNCVTCFGDVEKNKC